MKAAADGAGICLRQLDGWTRAGYVPFRQEGVNRRYTADAVKILLLIMAGRDGGLSPLRAVRRERESDPYLWEGPAGGHPRGRPPEIAPREVAPPSDLKSVELAVSRVESGLARVVKKLRQLEPVPPP